VDLEIALGLPTPASGAELRRRRQIEKLQSRFRAGTVAAPDAEQLLARYYATPAVADEDFSTRLAAVVEKMVTSQTSASAPAR